MPSHRKTERKKRGTQCGDYGAPKPPRNTRTPTRADDGTESASCKVQQKRVTERSKKDGNIHRDGTRTQVGITEESLAKTTKEMVTTQQGILEGMEKFLQQIARTQRIVRIEMAKFTLDLSRYHRSIDKAERGRNSGIKQQHD